MRCKATRISVQCRSCRNFVNDIAIKPGLEGYALPRKCPTYVFFCGKGFRAFAVMQWLGSSYVEICALDGDVKQYLFINTYRKLDLLVISGTLMSCWFGVVLAALVTSTKLSYVKPSQYCDWWLPLAGLLSQYFPGHSDPLRLAIPMCAGAMITDCGFSHHCGRHGEFCVQLALSPGLLAYWLMSVKALAVNLHQPTCCVVA